jgi:hypothetical protein
VPSGGLGVASASSYNLSRPLRACELRIASVILEEARSKFVDPYFASSAALTKCLPPLCIARGRGCAKR